MAKLTTKETQQFEEQGYLLVENVFPPEDVLDPIIEEYEDVLDRLSRDLFEAGDITSRYEHLPFGDRYTSIVIETGKAHSQHFDFSLPFSGVSPGTPFWTGAAVFNAFTWDPLLDVVESLIGPEIYSNPVQHVRIKPPERVLPRKEDGNPIIGRTAWHQDHGVVTPDADETHMLTVWFPLKDAPIENGPLQIVPGSHRNDLLTHCLDYQGNDAAFRGAREIPEKLFDKGATTPVPLKRGSALFLHKRTIHSSLPNESDDVRWSFDLRYNPVGEHTGREQFPGFVARSKSRPDSELRDPRRWTELWMECRERMSRLNQGGQTDVKFGRWNSDHPDCA